MLIPSEGAAPEMSSLVALSMCRLRDVRRRGCWARTMARTSLRTGPFGVDQPTQVQSATSGRSVPWARIPSRCRRRASSIRVRALPRQRPHRAAFHGPGLHRQTAMALVDPCCGRGQNRSRLVTVGHRVDDAQSGAAAHRFLCGPGQAPERRPANRPVLRSHDGQSSTLSLLLPGLSLRGVERGGALVADRLSVDPTRLHGGCSSSADSAGRGRRNPSARHAGPSLRAERPRTRPDGRRVEGRGGRSRRPCSIRRPDRHRPAARARRRDVRTYVPDHAASR